MSAEFLICDSEQSLWIAPTFAAQLASEQGFGAIKVYIHDIGKI